jgi:hypothetical protein
MIEIEIGHVTEENLQAKTYQKRELKFKRNEILDFRQMNKREDYYDLRKQAIT